MEAGHIHGLLEADFCLLYYLLPQEQDTPQATDFRFLPAFLMLLH